MSSGRYCMLGTVHGHADSAELREQIPFHATGFEGRGGSQRSRLGWPM